MPDLDVCLGKFVKCRRVCCPRHSVLRRLSRRWVPSVREDRVCYYEHYTFSLSILPIFTARPGALVCVGSLAEWLSLWLSSLAH